MNKILFKLIEGKGRFFLMRDVPTNPTDQYAGDQYYGSMMDEYHNSVDNCVSEALKNGEIVNPEVLTDIWEVNPGQFRFISTLIVLTDGDTFLLPEGMGFETFFPNGLMEGKSAIRLLPEKQVQKEESQEELLTEFIQKLLLRTSIEELKKEFTIKRKES